MSGIHACAVPKTLRECIAIAGRFLARGLEIGQQCLFVVHDNGPTIIRMALRSEMGDLEGLEASRRLLIVDSKETPLEGLFDPQRLCRSWEEMTNAALKDGFLGRRVAVEMTWALSLQPDALAAYEKNAEDLFRKVPLDALCIYNWHAFHERVIAAAAFGGHGRH